MNWFSLLIIALDFPLIFTALPKIAPIPEIQGIYLLCLSVCVVTMRRLFDWVGYKRLQLLSLLAFGLAAIVGVLAPSVGWLLFARGVQGVAGATLLIGGGRRWAALFTFMIAPLVAALFLTLWGWRSLFMLEAVLCIPALFFCQDRDSEGSQTKVDGLGLLFLALSCAFLYVGLWRTSWPYFIPAGVCAALLIWRENRTIAPILHFPLFRRPLFVVAFCAAGVAVFFMCSAFYLFSLSINAVFSPLVTGLALLALTAPLALVQLPIGRPKMFILVGLLSLCVAAAIEYYVPTLLWTLPALVLTGIGVALTLRTTTFAMMQILPTGIHGLALGTWFTLLGIIGALALVIPTNFFLLMLLAAAALILVLLSSPKFSSELA